MKKDKIKPMLFSVIKSYTPKQLTTDVISGIIVAIIALPLSIALALASGVGPEEGLYTAIVAGFIISFLGGDHPIPLTNQEVDDIFAQTDEQQKTARPKVTYEPGEIVTILEGAFKGSSGPIDEVDPDRGRLKVTVTIFGRPVSVELEYWQVERQQAPAPGVHG